VTSLRLLVVDDDAVDRITVKRLISRSGLRDTVVQEASDSAGALAVLAEEGGGRADCILLDYHLAGETGLDVLEALRVRQISTPVIVLTGQSDPETAAALVKAGALEFLTKDGLTSERVEQAVRGAIRVAQAEQEAQQVRERLSATLKSIADAVVTVDAEGHIAYMNTAAEHLTGWSLDDAIGRPMEQVVPLREGIAQMETAANQERVETEFTAHDGRHLYVDVTAAPLRNSGGDATGAVIAIRDITARRTAETELASANQLLQDQAVEMELANEQLLEINHEADKAREEADRARGEVEALNRVGNALASELDREKIVQTVTDAATTLTGAKFGAFFYNVLDQQGAKLTLYALSGAPRRQRQVALIAR
jgi:PAS domain S-box-containing protein